MKIALTTGWMTERDGIADYSAHFAQGLRAAGCGVQIVPLEHDQGSAAFYRRAAHQANQADLAHLQFNYLYFNGELPYRNRFFSFSRALRVPLVITAHEVRLGFGAQLRGFSSAWKERCFLTTRGIWNSWSVRMHREIYDSAQALITHTTEQADLIRPLLHFPERLHIIPHGIPEVSAPDLQYDREQARRELGLEGRRVVTVFGFINARKDYQRIASALRALPQDILLLIAGGPMTPRSSDQQYYKSIAGSFEERGLRQRLKITGYLPAEKIPQVMAATDLCIAPYHSQAASGALSLALGYHLPTLASDTAVHQEINDRLACLRLYRRHDTDDLAAKIAELLADPSGCAHLARMAQEYACRFSYTRIAEETKEIYEQCLAVDP